jgi:Trimeric coiled-coil oligomerisation domain of matrilin.
MEPERPSVEERLDALGRRLEAVERRLHALEHPFSRPPRTEAEAEADAAQEAAAGPPPPRRTVRGFPSSVARSS